MSASVELPTATAVHAGPPARDEQWLRDAARARLLSWLSLVWMTAEGAVGVIAGLLAGSVALTGFGLSSAVEGLASVIVIWRFTGSRTHSATSEASAQKAVAISFLLLAPYVAVESVLHLVSGEAASTSIAGIVVTVGSIIFMPLLGRAKLRLGARLGSGATAGEGTQNILCALLAGATLIGLLGQSLLGVSWLDPLAGLFIAAVAVREGFKSWSGEVCADCAPVGFASDADCDDGCCD
jgi:divalent metal cation (Fe/Co/Zn/Cd) transporter